ncbi:MAG: aminopeptidase P family protein [Bacteroidales bacterium]|nr:aminopeptidase P family protein [Bacteroidales bacterium]
MFESKVYTERRDQLRSLVKNGIGLFPGNNESPINYPDNTYHFRQDSSFLYFFGYNKPDMAGIIDFETGEDHLFGNDVDMDGIIWMGAQPKMADQAEQVGVKNVSPRNSLTDVIKSAMADGRTIHYLPPYRGDQIIELSEMLSSSNQEAKQNFSVSLIKGVIELRSIKSEIELAEIEKMVDVAYEMHTTAMKMAYPGIPEKEVFGAVEGIALSKAYLTSFPIILTINGQILHNHYHGNMLKEGRLLVTDCGAESEMGYSSDITRTCPVGGKFSRRQKDIYSIVLKAITETTAATKPGMLHKDLHMMAARIIASDLKDLGLMKGDVDEIVQAGAHALFFPHGLGHMMGMDVHDMEGLGENYVGYDESIQRSTQFGTAFLRLGKELKPGYVITNEPGCYFIPALIDIWRSEKKFTEFINYDAVESYKDFGGARIEDDVLVTETGSRVLGKPIPKTIEEVENTMKR